MMGHQVRFWNRFDHAFSALAALLCAVAVFLHYPGHVSMDTSIQLHEARLGHTITWAPRFMSALLRVLGGGAVACALFAALNATLIYAAFSLAWASGRTSGEIAEPPPTRWKDAALKLVALFLLLNPLIFLYVGIVWKDVLFASLLAFSASMMLFGAGRRKASLWYWLVPVMLVHAAIFTRQHGVFLAVFMLPACILLYAVAEDGKLLRAVRFALAYAGFAFVFQFGLNTVMPHGTDPAMSSVGLRNLQAYDLSGMVVEGLSPSTLPNKMAEDEFVEGVRTSYTPQRIDVLFNDANANRAFATVSNDEMRKAWLSAIMNHPVIYAEMKSKQVGWLIGLQRLDKCLPIHLGVAGNEAYLAPLDIAPGTDRFDSSLYKLSNLSRHLFLHRHWFFVALLGVAIGFVTWKHRALGRRMSLAFGSCLTGAVAFYGTFFVTTIACDFRYLFPGLVLCSVLMVGLASRMRLLTSWVAPRD